MPSDAEAVAVVVLAAGSGTRAGQARNKVLLPLAGDPLYAWSLRAAAEISGPRRIMLVVAEGDRAAVEPSLAGIDPSVDVVVGGATRHESEWCALQALASAIDAGRIDVVVIHDAARPLARTTLYQTVIETARVHGGAIPVRPQPAVIAADGSDATAASVGELLVGVQTPQAFRAEPLLAAYRAAEVDGFRATDTASCFERYTTLEVRGVPAPADNVKVTFPGDVEMAERLLRSQPAQ